MAYLMDAQIMDEDCKLSNMDELKDLIRDERIELMVYWGGTEEKRFCYLMSIPSVDMQ